MDLAKLAFDIAGRLMPLPEDARIDVLSRVDGLLNGFDDEEEPEPEPVRKPRKEKPAKSAPKGKAKGRAAYEPTANQILGLLRVNPEGLSPRQIAEELNLDPQSSVVQGALALLLDSKRARATGSTTTRKYFSKEIA